MIVTYDPDLRIVGKSIQPDPSRYSMGRARKCLLSGHNGGAFAKPPEISEHAFLFSRISRKERGTPTNVSAQRKRNARNESDGTDSP